MIKHWLAVDIGTTGTKAAILDADGRALRSSSHSYAPTSSAGGVVEQDAADWWQAVVTAARALDCSEVEAIALTGQMQDLILLDAAKNPMRPVILYNDTRAGEEIEHIRVQLGDETLRRVTGNDQDASSLLAKLLWLHRHESRSLQGSAHLLTGAADYVALQLTGELASDQTTASTTGLFDINERRAFAAEIGVTKLTHLFPNIVAGGSLVGTVLPAAARQLGVRAGIPVHLGPGDAGAATLGVGSGEPGRPYAYIGTSGWIALTLTQITSPDKGAFNLAHPQAGHYFCVAPLLTAGGNLDWAAQLFAVTDYESLMNEALERQPGDLIYLPYLNGERSPFRDAQARGAFIGLSTHHQRADLCRAVMEGVVFAYRHALEALQPSNVQSLILTGGGARSLGWCQLFADVLNLRIDIAGNAEFVGVRGAVLAAQMARGERNNFILTDDVVITQTLLPRPEPRHDAQYQRFRSAYPALKPLFHSI